MNQTRSQIWVFVIVMLAGVIAWDRWSVMRAAEDSLQEVVNQTDEIQKKLKQIQSLRDRPTVIASTASSPDEVLQLIESARGAAGWQPRNIIAQQPQIPRRIDRSDYLQRATELRIQSVTLPSLVTFCRELTTDEPGAAAGRRVSRILLRPTRQARIGVKPDQVSSDGSTQEVWDVDLTLTQTIYSPKSQNES